jgi:transcriptional regulator NrdR family protein
MKCPICRKEATDTRKEWDYSVFHVKLFNCNNCKKKFKAYYKEGKLRHTIPKSK